MRFQKGHDPRRNKAGRPLGAQNKRTLIRDALNDVYGKEGEQAFWKAVAVQAKAGCTQSAVLIANRLIPVLKSEIPHVELDLPKGDALEVATYLIESAASGHLSPDQLGAFIGAITAALKIEEIVELEPRIAKLEAKK